MSYQVLARKWRPRTFAEVVGQEHVLRALINGLEHERVHHAFLFTGTRGVGKTTIARVLAKSLNCERGVTATPCGECSACREIDEGRFVDLIEVDAASRTKVEDTRELLENVQYAPSRGRYKVYLIDEVHMLSGHSFNALLKTLEEPPPHVKFLLATTDPQRLPVTILSRCLQFNLKRLPQELIVNHLVHLLGEEGIGYEQAALTHLARAADGSMRDALSLLDQAIAYGGGTVGSDDVRAMLGTIEHTHVYALLEALAAGDAGALLEIVHALAEQAPDFSGVLSELVSALHRIAMAQVVPEAVDDGAGDRDDVLRLAGLLSPEDVQLSYQIGLIGRRDLSLAPDPRSGFEMVLLRMHAFRPEQGAVAEPRGTRPVRHKTPATQPAAPAKGATEPPAAQQTAMAADDWNAVVASLDVGGVVKELAANCVLKQRDAASIHLVLSPAHESLLGKEREKRLREALQAYYGSKLKLKISVGSVEDETPALRQQRLQGERHEAAVRAIEEDANVKALRDTFSADLQPRMIQPTD